MEDVFETRWLLDDDDDGYDDTEYLTIDNK